MRPGFSVAVLLSVAVVFAACDQRAPTDPARSAVPQSVILDGSAGGNPHFFFLPPLVKNPTVTGVFNANLAPTVEICRTTQQDAAGHCVSLLARFRRFPQAGDDAQAITVSVNGQHYALNWQSNNYNLGTDVPFRVVVLIGEQQLGYVDLVKRSANNYRNHATNEVIKRAVNGDLPIAFRIERGALCANTTECFEGLVGPAGGTFTIDRADGTKPAGTQFPAGALENTVTLIIDRVLGECLPTDAPQYQGCYRFRTEPAVEEFELPATVGVCLFDASALSYFNDGQLRLWKWSEVVGDGIVELERVTVEYLNCPTITPTIGLKTGSTMLLGAARTAEFLLKPLASLLGPRDAYALIPYEGGKLINFSRVGWVRPLNVDIKSGNNQSGPAGEALPLPASIRVTNKYGLTVQGVPGRAVTFAPSGDGAANPPATFTDGLGEAFSIWTLATQPGANTLRARALTSRAIAPVPYEAEAFFNATGVDYTLLWLPLLGPTSAVGAPWVTGLQPTVVVSVVNGPVLSTLPTTEVTDGYSAAWDVSTIDHSLIYRLTVQLNGANIGYIDLNVRDNTLRNLLTDTRVLNLATDATLKMKFKLVQ
jgi:hypothetical protein